MSSFSARNLAASVLQLALATASDPRCKNPPGEPFVALAFPRSVQASSIL
eukprot:CAMPEP_0183378016 /NCGR_PEP_ID=MMETSP0164_2-20130417/124576_1 /TAXON_ID=221442 /ORGANISM="Coccolithus pelagicus ssp braarudi, Strain PLY182g" /LENGTH=49 /DNA_ID=CAMNT_0025555547 /DNA_START=574 /DNA_END=723 /DNA_ORIENTATION=+